MGNYIERLKNKLKIKQPDANQPIKAWLFVLLLNLIGFSGFIYIKLNNIQLNN